MTRSAKIVTPALIVGTVLVGATAFAAPGGLPACMAGLSTCTGSLTTCDNSLASCNTNLSVAQACGNGVIDPGEQCDQSNLNGQTCASQGFAAGALKCGPGCMLDTSGCSTARLVDNGDGTVSDLVTGLMWEKKTPGQCVNLVSGLPVICFSNADCTGNGGGGTCVSCLHCVNSTYTWTASGSPNYPPDGTAFLSFLFGLNGGVQDSQGQWTCFAGHCDWRLPTIEELEGIVDFTQGQCGGGSGPCIDPSFGPTQSQSSYYWSNTTSTYTNTAAEYMNFLDGGPRNGGGKTISIYARAVRGGP